ncbi:MAG: ATP-binding protein [Oscillospiraceae bacterium]
MAGAAANLCSAPVFMRKQSNMKISKSKAFIDKQKCIGCGACISVCPKKAIIMKPGWYCFIHEDKCVGCGKCVSICHKQASQYRS